MTGTKPSIGFIGLGLMGVAMAHRLLDLGYPLTVLANRSRTNVDALIARGASEASTASALAGASDMVFLCVDTSASVEGRMLGEDGVIAGLKEGAIVIDFGTSLPESTRMLGEKVSAAGAAYLDAPLGRTPAHAYDGLLNIMCAGDTDAFERAKPVLEDLGENVFHLGPLGTGHTVKLLNNFFGMTVANAMSEVFAMADLTGVDRQKVFDVISAGPLNSGMIGFVKGYAVDGDPAQLAFAVRNAAKDVGYYGEMAKALGVDSIMASGTSKALNTAVEDGRGDTLVAEQVDFFKDRYAKS